MDVGADDRPVVDALAAVLAVVAVAAQDTAQRPDARERLQKIKTLMDGFTAAVEDLAKAQTTLLAQIDKRSVVSEEWTKSVAAQLASPTMAKVDNRLEIERLLFQADAKVSSLRAAAWNSRTTPSALQTRRWRSRSPRPILPAPPAGGDH